MKSTCFVFKLKQKKQVLALVLIEDLGFLPLVREIQRLTCNWMNTMMTDTYLMWKPISLVNLIYKVFVSDGKTGHLRKVCNNMYRTIIIKVYSIDNNTIYVYKYN
jgi:hypothetical protein